MSRPGRRIPGLVRSVVVDRGLVAIGVPFFLVACTVSYYGTLHRKPSGDTYGTVYTAVAVVRSHTIWLDDYLPYIQARSGEQPYMLRPGRHGHVVNTTPFAASVLAVPVVGAATLTGAEPADWDHWMEAGLLTAALTTAASVAAMFILLTRLTTRTRAALIAATFAWGTFLWGVSGQALWQHTGATLALVLALLALVERKPGLAGLAIGAMVAFRLSTPVIALFLLPLLDRRLGAWARFAAGAAPFAIGLALYNRVAFGSAVEQGYGSAHVTSATDVGSGRALDGIPGLLVSPGRGILWYSPVLVFAVVGAIRGFRTPLYRWSAIGAIAYVVAVANVEQWWGGESFGPRKLSEALPLLALLLVPALDAIARTRWIWVYGGLLAWSVLVEVLAAAAWSSIRWYDDHDLTTRSTWWSPTDNEIVALVSAVGDVPLRVAAMAAIFVGALMLGFLSSVVAGQWRTADG